MANMTKSKVKREHYLELIRVFPLRRIRTDDELSQAITVINSLIDRDKLVSGEQDYLDVLSDLVENYEAEVHPIAPVSDAEMLRHLLEAKRVTQTKAAADTKIPRSTISEILAGKRTLNRRQIGILSRYFHVDPGVFTFS
jgi:HTH-type transcriptional regulator / antitoxin HigA